MNHPEKLWAEAAVAAMLERVRKLVAAEYVRLIADLRR